MKNLIICIFLSIYVFANTENEINVRNLSANLDELVFQKAKSEKVEQLIKKSISFTYGKGDEIFIFADPGCRYTRMLFLSDILEDYKVNVILMDIYRFQDTSSYISYILKGKGGMVKFFEVMSGQKDGMSEEFSERVEQQYERIDELLEYVSITGVPQITDYLGREIGLVSGTYYLK